MISSRLLLGLDFADLTVDQAASHIAARPPLAPFSYVVTPNADHLVRLAGDQTLRAIYHGAALCLLDSRVVGGLARLLGLTAPQVVTGSDLTERLLANHVHCGERITIVGLSPAWLPKLCHRYGLAEPAHFDPPMDFDKDPAAFSATVDFVRVNPARFVFLAVGSPRQEHLAAAIAATGAATGTGLCIGAALAFLTGAQRRAPVAMQHAGLEWLFRLATNPRRMARRYLIDSPRIIGLMLRQRLADGEAGRAPRV
ncbi:WecB/TagA/CpsF family glycosyltransferase [Rhodopila sp.]|uniref:WecB/TagA/CpsF family glycosyltransferase n=1 Tax=Rhodopila sp. TaxID=2480087 RepID=UPI003D137C2F